MIPISFYVSNIQKRLKLDIRYVLSGNFWLLFARFTAIGSGMLLTVAFANLLTPESFGFYKYIISLAGIVTAFSLSGIGVALINSIARGDEGTLRTTLIPSILYALPASAVAFAGSAYYFFMGNHQLAIALVAIAIVTPLFGSFGNYRHLFSGRSDFKTSAIIGTVRAVLPVACLLVVLIFVRNGLSIALWYFFSNAVVVISIYWYTVWKYQVPKVAESTASTIRFARYTSVLGFFSQVTSQADQFLIWHFVGPAGVAFYSFATSPVEQLQSVSGNIFSLAAPKLAQKSSDEVHISLPLRMKQMFLGLIPFTVLYILLAPLLYRFLFPTYTSVVWLSQIYAFILLLQPLGFVDAALIAREDTGKRNWLIASGQIAKLIFLVVGIAFHGIVGGVIALIASEVFTAFLSLIVLRHLIKSAKRVY